MAYGVHYSVFSCANQRDLYCIAYRQRSAVDRYHGAVDRQRQRAIVRQRRAIDR